MNLLCHKALNPDTVGLHLAATFAGFVDQAKSGAKHPLSLIHWHPTIAENLHLATEVLHNVKHTTQSAHTKISHILCPPSSKKDRE
jgi:hypothetical protein